MTAVWSLEWRLALTDRRRFMLSTLVPLLLALSVATGVAGPAPAAAVYLVLFVAFAVFGSALPLRWDGERGIVGRVVRGGVPAGRYLVGRSGACAAIDLVQLAPALLVAVLGAGGTVGGFAIALAALAATVWVSGLVGAIVAGVSRSLAETGLVAALAILLLVHMSGVLENPLPGSMLASLEAVSPFRVLHEALMDATGGVASTAAASALVWALVMPALVALMGGRLSRALGKVSSGGLEGV